MILGSYINCQYYKTEDEEDRKSATTNIILQMKKTGNSKIYRTQSLKPIKNQKAGCPLRRFSSRFNALHDKETRKHDVKKLKNRQKKNFVQQ